MLFLPFFQENSPRRTQNRIQMRKEQTGRPRRGLWRDRPAVDRDTTRKMRAATRRLPNYSKLAS